MSNTASLKKEYAERIACLLYTSIYWHDETMGADYTVEEIPADLVDEANEWRDKMLEKVAEFDDALMEKYFDDPSTITEEEVLRALRNATVQMAVVPMLCGCLLYTSWKLPATLLPVWNRKTLPDGISWILTGV